MKYLFYILILITTFSNVFSQSKKDFTDEEYEKLELKTKLLFSSYPDSVFYYTSIIEQSNNLLHVSFANTSNAYAFQLKGDTLKSNFELKKAEKTLKKITNRKDYQKSYTYFLNLSGLIEWKRKNFSKALSHFENGLKIAVDGNDYLQAIKFNNNSTLIMAEIGNYNSAIALSKKTDELIDKKQFKFNEEEYLNLKSNTNLNIARYYFYQYKSTDKNEKLLDSSLVYFNKALLFSNDLVLNKIIANKGIATILMTQSKLEQAENIYQNTLNIAKENKITSEIYNVYYNLGFLNFELKQFEKAELYFLKVNSIFKKDKTYINEYIFSNYYLAKINFERGNSEKAIAFSDIYLKEYQKNTALINTEEYIINSNKSKADLKKEIDIIKTKSKKKTLVKYILLTTASTFILFFILFNYFKRKEAEKKVLRIIAEFKNKAKVGEEKETISSTKDSIIDIEKEKEILKKLKKLEKEHYYLNGSFSQQEVAKKIKTNTTYLSYVVNKNYNQSFSSYYNELKINYVINEIIHNKIFREYSTQAIAEVAGYKNADSFTTAFKKKTGVTPYQFIIKTKGED